MSADTTYIISISQLNAENCQQILQLMTYNHGCIEFNYNTDINKVIAYIPQWQMDTNVMVFLRDDVTLGDALSSLGYLSYSFNLSYPSDLSPVNYIDTPLVECQLSQGEITP